MRGSSVSIRWRLGAGLAALALLAAACGGDDDEATDDTVALEEIEAIVDIDPCDLIDEPTASSLAGAEVDEAESSTDDDGTTTCDFPFADEEVADETGSAIAASLRIGPGDESDVPSGSALARSLDMGDAAGVETPDDAKVRVVYIVQEVVVFVEVVPGDGEVDEELIDEVVEFTETTEAPVTEAVTGEPFVPDETTTTFVDEEVPEGDIEIEVDDAPFEMSFDRAGGNFIATFEAEAGDIVYTRFPSATYGDPESTNCLRVSIIDPQDFSLNGVCVNPDGSSFLDRAELEVSGTYQLVLSGDATQTGSIEVEITSATDGEGTIEVDGATETATIEQAGAVMSLEFEAATGDALFVAFPAAAYDDPESTNCLRVSVFDPDDFALNGVCVNPDGSSFLSRFELETSGTYRLVLDGDADQTGSVDIQLTSAD
jgi:hypothetical protein